MSEQTQNILSRVPVELIEAYHAAALIVTANSEQINKLSDKRARLNRNIPRLEDAVAAAETIKAGILANHAVDKATTDQLNQAREAYQGAVVALENEKELLAAVERALRQEESKVSFLQAKKQTARVKIFSVVSELALAEIRALGQELFYLLDASARICGADYMGQPFEGLHPSIVAQRIKQIESELLGGIKL